jgi:aspartyl-tRNA(Asn)/glutamyl-tRNA(Gln) amidotransferase subunit C
MANLSKDDILKLARLSKLELTDEQVDRYRSELEKIVDYVDQLQSVDVSGLEPTNQVTGLTNVMRPDKVREYAPPAELLKNLPAREGDQIKVNKMIG